MIHFQDIQFRYEGTISSEIGVKDINLIVHTGECVLLCGRSGCGKTTLTKLINGLIPNYFPGELSGNVQIDDENILGMPMYYLATKVGSVFQNPRTQFFNVDVDSEIAFGIENIAVPPDELHQRLEYTLDSLKIHNLQGKNIFELSGGEKQKIAFASVYAMNPDIFLLDEPSSNLDGDSIRDLKNYLHILKQQGKTILIAEHRLYYLLDIADRIVYLADGKIEKIYTPQEFRSLSGATRKHMGLRTTDIQDVHPISYQRTFSQPILTVKDVSLFYKKHPVLEHISLQASKGDKGAYGALFRVRCMITEHLSKVPLGALDERRTGDIKTVLNEDIEKLELCLAHNIPELVGFATGPVVIFIYLMTINVPLAMISLIPLGITLIIMVGCFAFMAGMMPRVTEAMANFNSVIIEYINGMKLIKAYNMSRHSFQKFSGAIEEENRIWNKVSRKTGPFYAAFIVVLECGMALIIPIGGRLFLNGSITASIFLLFAYIGSLYLSELLPLQQLSMELAQSLNGVKKAKQILDLPIFDSVGDFPKSHDVTLKAVRFSYDGKTDVLTDCDLHVAEGEKVAIVGAPGAGKTTVIELISRFYDVTDGEVLIGGQK